MLSCEVNGETKYIWKFRDFAEEAIGDDKEASGEF